MVWKHNSGNFCSYQDSNCNLKKTYNLKESKKINFKEELHQINDIFSSNPININSNIINKECSKLDSNDCNNSKFEILDNIYNTRDLCILNNNKCKQKELKSNHIYSYSKNNNQYLYKYYKYKNKLHQIKK
jgi:hypothetical protein